MVACFAVTATLMAYEMSKMTGVPAFAQTSSILNNIALVAFCLSLLWTLFAGRDEQNYRDRFKKDGARLLVLLLGTWRRYDRALDSVRLISAPAYVRWRGRRGR